MTGCIALQALTKEPAERWYPDPLQDQLETQRKRLQWSCPSSSDSVHPAPPPSPASLQDQLETQRKQLQQELLTEEQRVAIKAETERQKAALGELEQRQGAADAEMVEAGGEDELDAFMGTVAVQLEQDKVGWSAAT